MANNVYGSGRKNVGSYQVAGKPYVTASTISSGEELDLQLPNISNNITVKLDSAGGGAGTRAAGSVTVKYPTASASPTYNASGTLESNHHGDTFGLDGTTFTVNYEGTGSFGDNEIKTYEQTGSALFFANVTKNANGIYLSVNNYTSSTAGGFTANDENPWSVSFWLNAQSGGDNFKTIFKFGSNSTNPGGNLTFTTIATINDATSGITIFQPNTTANGATRVDFDGAITTSVYHHYALTCNATASATYRLYKDGVLFGTGSMGAGADQLLPFSEHLQIGDAEQPPAVGNQELNGYLQTFGIWNKQLNATEANELYNSGSVKLAQNSTMAANLVDWWRFDSSSSGFQSSGDTEGTSYNSHKGTTLAASAFFAANVTVVQGVPIERHTTAEFYNAVTGAFSTTSNFGTFNVVTPNVTGSVINITATQTGSVANNKITHSANETFITAVDTTGGADAGGGGGGSLRVHFRSTGSLPNVANNRHYWELSSASEKIEMNVKTKEIYLSADGGDCDFSLQADLTNIPTSSMYQHTGSGVDE